MTSTLAKIVAETNWPMVAFVFAVCSGAISFGFSLKSDIRDLSTQVAQYHDTQTRTQMQVDQLYDHFIGQTFGMLEHPRP